jgi:hypothetical protein
MVPVASSMVAHDASRAASAALYPSRIATWVTAPGAYTDPAHRPIIEIRISKQFSSVLFRYSGEKRAKNASRAVQPPIFSIRVFQRSGSRTP